MKIEIKFEVGQKIWQIEINKWFMKLKEHIETIMFLLKGNIKETDAHQLVLGISWHYKRKNSWIRNKTARLVKKIRKVRPHNHSTYQKYDYSEAKHLYETQPQGLDFSEVTTGKYVVKIKEREEYAVKGERWCAYYIFPSRFSGVFEVGRLHERQPWLTLLDFTKRPSREVIDKDSAVVFRFATDEEIKDFENRRKKYLEIKKEIDKKQEELTKLYKEL